jgi:hypothetical protein
MLIISETFGSHLMVLRLSCASEGQKRLVESTRTLRAIYRPTMGRLRQALLAANLQERRHGNACPALDLLSLGRLLEPQQDPDQQTAPQESLKESCD